MAELVNVLKGYENVDEENVEEWLQNYACEPGFHYVKC
jgi:hypothetical protein